MIRITPNLPAGHGELLVRPPYETWATLAEENRLQADGWTMEVASRSFQDVRRTARAEALEGAERFSARLGVPVRRLGDPAGPIVMTGHQPELFHPGVWVKDFLLQRVADEIGAGAVDVVVDSDGFDEVSITAPCLVPEVRRCRQYLAIGAADTCYACASLPSRDAIEDFCRVGDAMLATLPAPSIRRHFGDFCSVLRSAADDAESLSELVTFARRRFESPAGTDYGELPVSLLARGEGFSAFVADLALGAERFAAAYNAELEEFRAVNRTRSSKQPFPNLEVREGLVELPLWSLGSHRRETVWARVGEREVTLEAAGDTLASLPRSDGEAAIAAVQSIGTLIAPKALSLTMFLRLFCCDLFIHGVGGARYDRVTDGVCRRYYGVEPPRYAVASLTMYLPLGARVVTEEEVGEARERLNRLEHNPDALLGEVEFDSPEERGRASALAAEKSRLVDDIKAPGADKKALGARIREVNAGLSALLAPLRAEYQDELATLEAQQAASEVFSDRSYPFCFWSPHDVADKVW